MLDRLVEVARRQGPIPEGHFRVMTIETDNRLGCKDFDSRERAQQYANDAASEADDRTPIEIVLDRNLKVVHKGRPYYLK